MPGYVVAILLTKVRLDVELLWKFLPGFFAICLLASANYVINEWLDAEFDKYHPIKKNRSVVTEDVKGCVVYTLWTILSVGGFVISWFVNLPFLVMGVFLWLMGVVYNVRPFRTKDIPFLDVLSESVNNAIRLLMGWFIITELFFPPCSLIFGYWMGGAYLMATKRYAEYRMINDRALAALYRKSFRYYSEKSLLISALFYAMTSVFFIGIFLVKYRVELVLFIPILIGLFCYYLNLSFSGDSPVQRPEKLFHEKGLMLYCFITAACFVILLFVDIRQLSFLTSVRLLPLPEVITQLGNNAK